MIAYWVAGPARCARLLHAGPVAYGADLMHHRGSQDRGGPHGYSGDGQARKRGWRPLRQAIGCTGGHARGASAHADW